VLRGRYYRIVSRRFTAPSVTANARRRGPQSLRQMNPGEKSLVTGIRYKAALPEAMHPSRGTGQGAAIIPGTGADTGMLPDIVAKPGKPCRAPRHGTGADCQDTKVLL
jgi:hypothetical protein